MRLTGILGNRAENKALKWLRRQGLKLLERNYHSQFGELDLVLRDKDYLVFVEVRYRKDPAFGGAAASVDARKQAKLRRTAEAYLIHHKLTDQACRFDILCLDGPLDNPQVNWIQNAF